jgi:hypothetical protein
VDVFEVADGKGKVWKLGRATGESRKAMIAAVAQVAWNNIAEMQILCPESYPESRDAFTRDVGAGEHKPGGKLWTAMTRGPLHAALFTFALMKPHHPDCKLSDAQELLAANKDGVSAAVAVLVPGFFDMLADHPETPPDHRAALRAAAAKTREATPTVSPTPSSLTTGSA